MPKVAVIIPCHNESRRLNTERITAFLLHHPDVKIIFVNDGSTDNTGELLENIRRLAPASVDIFNSPVRKGKAEAVRLGLLKGLSDMNITYLGFLDADLAVSPEEFYRLFKIISSTINKFIFGSRIKKLGSVINRNEWRHIFGRFIATLVVLITRVDVYDTQCSAKIFRAEIVPVFVKEPFRTQWLFDVEIICRMRKELGELSLLGYEEPLKEWTDIEGSKLKWFNIFKIIKEIVIIYKYYRNNKRQIS